MEGVCGCKGVQTEPFPEQNHCGNKCKTQGADDSLLKFPHGSHCLVRRNSACDLPNNPAIQEAASPELGSWVPRLEASWRPDCASSRQNPSKADTMLCSCCHRQSCASKPAPKCQSWLQGLEKHLLAASALRAGTTDTSLTSPLAPTGWKTNVWVGRDDCNLKKANKARKAPKSVLQLCTTHCFSVELCGTLCPQCPDGSRTPLNTDEPEPR